VCLPFLGAPAIAGDEPVTRFGVTLGGSLVTDDGYASRGGSGEGYQVRPSVVLGAVTEVPLDSQTLLSVEIACGRHSGDWSGEYVTYYPRTTRWTNSTRLAMTSGVHVRRVLVKGSIRPWVGIAAGATTTWHDHGRAVRRDWSVSPYGTGGVERFKFKLGRKAPDLSLPVHLAIGVDFEHLSRVEVRGGPVFSHPQARQLFGLGAHDYRWDLQFRATFFLTSRRAPSK
jgi:hypothetical protein